ncbi:MAG: SDR family oxidoreductase [Solirubrobacterales bacterium]|nr:SDR family oxidoreductase [Solirubrobacterales bacterium]MBV9915838.1 SDR family oxidoreductase [Solirubrobacterales bacterium]
MSAAPLAGRVALVAGASSGIGAATARLLAEAGATVHVAARRRPELGAGVAAHELDITDRAAVAALTSALTEREPIHTLVVAAGTNLTERSLERLTPEAWDTMVAVNLTGAFNLVHALLPGLREAQGDVVLIGSVSGSWPDPSGAAYQAAKAGLLAFARAAGFEEHGHGVRFTTILPGVVDTPLLDRRPTPPSPEMRAHMLAPEDVAEACLFAVTRPPRAHVAELTILPSALQSVGKTNVANPSPPSAEPAANDASADL